MPRTVFENSMVAHVWAQQDQAEGRSHNGNFSFQGQALYSYSTVIAAFTAARASNGDRVVLVTSQTYSKTTSGKHMPALRRALHRLPNIKVLHVPYPGVHSAVGLGAMRGSVATNVATLVQNFETRADRLAKFHVRDYSADHARDTHEALTGADLLTSRMIALSTGASDVFDYCAAFDLPVPDVGLAAKQEALSVAFARYFNPTAIAKREKKAAATGARHWKVAQHVAAFMEGVSDRAPSFHFVPYSAKEPIASALGYASFWQLERAVAARDNANKAATRRTSDTSHVTAAQWKEGKGREIESNGFNIPTFVRRVGDTLQTSRGADCPFAHAVVAFMKAQDCRANAKEWKRNGQTIRVGHFHVDAIDAHGNMQAGCHELGYDEMLRLAIREIPEKVKATFPLPVIIR